MSNSSAGNVGLSQLDVARAPAPLIHEGENSQLLPGLMAQPVCPDLPLHRPRGAMDVDSLHFFWVFDMTVIGFLIGTVSFSWQHTVVEVFK